MRLQVAKQSSSFSQHLCGVLKNRNNFLETIKYCLSRAALKLMFMQHFRAQILRSFDQKTFPSIVPINDSNINFPLAPIDQ